MSRKNKKIWILKLVFLILFVALIAMIILLHKTKAQSPENFHKRLLNGINNLNYTYTDNSEKVYPKKVQILGKKKKVTESNGNITYYDYSTKETIYTYPDAERKLLYHNKGIEDMDYYKKYIKQYIESGVYTFSYKGKEEYNGTQCSVIEFVSPNGNGAIMWINDKLDIVDKITTFGEIDGKRKEIQTEELRFHTGDNTHNDVDVPSYVKTEYTDRTN